MRFLDYSILFVHWVDHAQDQKIRRASRKTSKFKCTCLQFSTSGSFRAYNNIGQGRTPRSSQLEAPFSKAILVNRAQGCSPESVKNRYPLHMDFPIYTKASTEHYDIVILGNRLSL